MSGYQRFLPRHTTRTTAHAVAETAEPAEVKVGQRFRTGDALLKSAEIRSKDVSFQQASAGVQRQRSHGISELQQLQQPQQEPAATIPKIPDGDAISDTWSLTKRTDPKEPPSDIPTEWISGVARLTAMATPRTYPAHAWRQLITDAERFLEEWAQQAAALGWPAWELFGCHRRAPWGRIDGMGLVLLLHGDPLAALTASEAVIRRPSGAHQTWRRKQRDPLTAEERCLVWELA
jgi:hypothetical protein